MGSPVRLFPKCDVISLAQARTPARLALPLPSILFLDLHGREVAYGCLGAGPAKPGRQLVQTVAQVSQAGGAGVAAIVG
jgi:hypothetical protein